MGIREKQQSQSLEADRMGSRTVGGEGKDTGMEITFAEYVLPNDAKYMYGQEIFEIFVDNRKKQQGITGIFRNFAFNCMHIVSFG